jgi:hypothetical protein
VTTYVSERDTPRRARSIGLCLSALVDVPAKPVSDRQGRHEIAADVSRLLPGHINQRRWIRFNSTATDA